MRIGPRTSFARNASVSVGSQQTLAEDHEERREHRDFAALASAFELEPTTLSHVRSSLGLRERSASAFWESGN